MIKDITISVKGSPPPRMSYGLLFMAEGNVAYITPAIEQVADAEALRGMTRLMNR